MVDSGSVLIIVLNTVTIHEAYSWPRMDESLDTLEGSQYISMLDLLSSYWQLPITPEAREKSSFVTRKGLFKWKVPPFGQLPSSG